MRTVPRGKTSMLFEHLDPRLHPCDMGPTHEDPARISNAVADAGNIVRIVLYFPANMACWCSALHDLDWPHVGSVERLAHSSAVRWHEDNPDMRARRLVEGEEFLTDVHSTHTPMKQIHWAAKPPRFMSVLSSHVKNAASRLRRPVAFGMRDGQRRWEWTWGSTAHVSPSKKSWAQTRKTVVLRPESMITCCWPSW